jgi:hypothetical protein
MRKLSSWLINGRLCGSTQVPAYVQNSAQMSTLCLPSVVKLKSSHMTLTLLLVVFVAKLLKFVDFKPLGPHNCGFKSCLELGILSFGEAIQ